MNLGIIFLMCNAIIILLLVVLFFVVACMSECKKINEKINKCNGDYEPKVNKYAEKFKAVSKREEKILDGEDYSFDVFESVDE